MRDVVPRTTLSVKNMLGRGIPRLFIHASLDTYDIDETVRDIIENYLLYMDDMYEDNINLLMFGHNGTGKSYCAALLIKEAYIQRYTSYMVTVQTYLDLQFEKHNPDVHAKLEAYANADFLVLDELGKEIQAKTEFNIIILEELLRIRDTKGLPTIICTNLDIEDLYEQYGDSIRSLIDGNYVKIKFKEGDFRKEVTGEKKGIKLLFDK